MSTVTNGSVVEFAAQTVQPGEEARSLCAALLEQSRINPDNYTHVENVVKELVALADFTIHEPTDPADPE